MSHEDHASHQGVIDLVKGYNAQPKDNSIAIMLDTNGFEVRNGDLLQPLTLQTGLGITFTSSRGIRTPNCISVNYGDFVNEAEAGDMLLVDGVVDGVMVARGDLGVQLHIEEVQFLQEEITGTCQSMEKAFIVATNMLEDMIAHPTPTKEGVFDITISIQGGTDAVMLSEEATKGKFLLEAVKVMQTVALRTETTISGGEMPSNLDQAFKNYMSDMFAYHATDKKEAAKELWRLTKATSSCWAIPCEFTCAISKLLSTLSELESKVESDQDLHEGLITTILHLSIYGNNEKFIEENSIVIHLLTESMKFIIIETRRYATDALFSLSGLDSNKVIIGNSSALVFLLELLRPELPCAMKNVASTIFNICIICENKAKFTEIWVVKTLWIVIKGEEFENHTLVELEDIGITRARRKANGIIEKIHKLFSTPQLELSVTSGSREFSLGCDVGIDTAFASFTKYTAGIVLNKPDFSISLVMMIKGRH
ncbi:hypothetical protein REPUB_Repub03eG0129200 [Reevesia pubescens]